MTQRPQGLDALLNYITERIDVTCEHRGGSYLDRIICPAPCNAMHHCCKDCGEPLDECALAGSTTALAAHDPRFSDNHLGRSFNGTRLEDNCPCPKAACGLVIQDGIDPACTEHPSERLKPIRQSHRAEDCPEAHQPMYVRWESRHTIPAEVCIGCSDPSAGRWVPVSDCPEALAKLEADPGCTQTYGVIQRTEDGQ